MSFSSFRLASIVFILSCGFTTAVLAWEFNVKQLGKGENVTLAAPATSILPDDSRLFLGATDLPQTLKLRINKKQRGKSLRLGIYDRTADRVRYITIKSNAPYLYHFQSTESIFIKSEDAHPKPLGIRIESNKPLWIGR